MIYSQDPKVYNYRPNHQCANSECLKPVLRDGQKYYCPDCYNNLKYENEKNKKLIRKLFEEFGHKESCTLLKEEGDCNCGYSEYIII